MTQMHKEYSEYATCHRCGHKKYCMLEGKHYTCYSCHYMNFNGLRKVNDDGNDRHQVQNLQGQRP